MDVHTSICGERSSEAIFANQRDDAGGALQAGDPLARIRAGVVARVGVEIVVAHTDAEVLVDVPAGADAGVPAAAPGAVAVGEAEVLADGVVVAVVVVVGPEPAGVRTHIPLRRQVDAAVGAEQPATQRVGGRALVDRVGVEHVAYAEVAEVRVAGLDAEAQVLAGLPAIAAEQAVAGAATAMAI